MTVVAGVRALAPPTRTHSPQAWVEARKASDFSKFAPFLKEWIEVRREQVWPATVVSHKEHAPLAWHSHAAAARSTHMHLWLPPTPVTQILLVGTPY